MASGEIAPNAIALRLWKSSAYVAAIKPDLITVQETPPIFSETILAALRSSAAMVLASLAGI
jgi:hypothetical protein